MSTVTIGNHKYTRTSLTESQTRGMRWDRYEPEGMNACYAEPGAKYMQGPGAKYRRTADVGLAGGANFPRYSYWSLVEE